MLRYCACVLLFASIVPIHAEEALQPFFDSTNGKWGFCKGPAEDPELFDHYQLKNREIRVPAQFAWVGCFLDGTARVTREGGENKPYKWGWINEKGEEIIPCQFENATDMIDGVA